MTDNGFFNACDRISRIVDSGQYERLRWARTEAPMLARLVELVQGAFAEREEFSLAEEGSGHAFRRFVIKVHGNRVFAVRVELAGRTVRFDSDMIERSSYIVREGDAVSAPYDEIDDAWIAAALAAQFERVCAKPDCAVSNGEAKAFPKNRPADRKPDAKPTPDYRQVRPPAARANRPIS